MGLDQFAFATLAEKVGDAVVDFPHSLGVSKYDINAEPAIQLAYWRKHPNLHGWMENLYHERGGKNSFNGDAIRLTLDDIKALEKAVEDETLPYTEGFFFGTSTPDCKFGDRDFVWAARNALALGLAVYYTSSW